VRVPLTASALRPLFVRTWLSAAAAPAGMPAPPIARVGGSALGVSVADGVPEADGEAVTVMVTVPVTVGEGVPEGCGVSLPVGDAVALGDDVLFGPGVTVFAGVSVAAVAADCAARTVGVIVLPTRPASATSGLAGRPEDT